MNVGIFESLAADQSDARLASRRALVLSRDRLDARLGKFLGASRSPQEFDARFDLVAEDFVGIIRVAADEVGHDDPDSLVDTLRAHYADKEHWIQDAVKKPGDLHKKFGVPEDEKIPESKIENAEETGDKNLKEKAQFAENVKKGAKESGKPPWLKGDEEDEKDEGKKEKKDEDDQDEGTINPKSKADKDSAPDEELTFGAAVKTAAHPEFDECPKCHGSGQVDGKDCSQCNGKGAYHKEESEERESAVRTSAPAGNTGLAGPSPKMDKARWTPQSVKPIDVPSERHPTVQKDLTEVMPKENEGPPGDASKIDEINALTTQETLPSGTGMDDSGFNADKNTGTSGPTKTWGTDGREADPVGSASLEA